MKVGVIGGGYIGLPISAILTDWGHDVIGCEIDESKLKLLSQGVCPIYEPDLEKLLQKGLDSKRLRFTKDISELSDRSIYFLAVGTPKDPKTGKANLKYIKQAAKDLSEYISEDSIVITKSTVPPGTNKALESIIKNNTDKSFEIVSNPEFLREGSAVSDFYDPDRVVIGSKNTFSIQDRIEKLYKPLKDKDVPFVYTSLESAELIKYASNSFLALSISYINELSRLAENYDADIDDVSKGMKLDQRIGPKAFLGAGLGFGGSCFPKDVSALVKIGQANGLDISTLKDTLKINDEQTDFFFQKIQNYLKSKSIDLSNITLGVLGLAFKSNTDDIRYSRSIKLIQKLLDQGYNIKTYDPMAMPNSQKQLGKIDGLTYMETASQTLDDIEGLIIATNWDEFQDLDYTRLEGKVIFDGRNILDKEKIENQNIDYIGVGK